MNPVPLSWMLLGAVALSIATGATGYIAGGRHKADEIAAEQAENAKLVADTREVAKAATAEAISAIEVRNVTIRQKAETITREVPVYRDCRHDPDGLRVINDALRGPEARPDDSRSVPAAHPDGR